MFGAPEDVERLAVWVQESRTALTHKVETVRRAVKRAGGEVLDLSMALGVECFSAPPYPNEHLNERGREYVAARLAAAVLADPRR